MFGLLAPLIYIQLSPERITLRDPKRGVEISDVPDAAITELPKKVILAIGKAARTTVHSGPVEILNPFAHPRSMMSDFSLGEAVMKRFLAQMCQGQFFAMPPRVVLHLLGDPAGGFTQIEVRAFREMLLGAGAKQVVIWQGATLSDADLLAGRFPSTGQQLL